MSLTRKQRRASLAEDATATRLSVFRHLTTAQHMSAFIELTALKPEIGYVIDVLSIDLRGLTAFAASQLRSVLLMTPNIQDLILYLPLPVPTALLTGIHFHRLDFIATNVPHATLHPFLAEHASLTSLILGACGRTSTCPLQGLNFDLLCSLQCDTSCILALPYTNAVLLKLQLEDTGADASTPIVLRNMRPPTLLYALAIDFCPSDYEILGDISRIAPNIRKLKLVEKKVATRRTAQMRRPWNDRVGWHASLCGLAQLEELVLVTSTILVADKAHREEEELKIVTEWVTGTHARRRSLPTAHPALHRVTLRYGVEEPSVDVMSDWYKRNGLWMRTAHAEGISAKEAEEV